ncbi:LytTR family DNA-binding domain-containing protein [Radiobacillus kanasensis]|uniref:LytR/AlgR family response regulator transcription factor n=1 Tax=Radiobacillus kanasensis TaxID=2844358 RepID=UPI001E36E735|nr:LytTR family DNA-binding domain-containing protein [Radiobacillus kanasensis]UFT98196.1 LytTR family DNA-binding domain-containing protein [Radiobacillus kanasensis]
MTKPIKVLIVDDERYSREELSHLLSTYTTIRIVGEADSGDQCITKALELQPDVIFLDIEMPKRNGMDTANMLKELKKTPLIVFATAYPNFAVEAFRQEAVDYLVKPFDPQELDETVHRLERYLLTDREENAGPTPFKLAIEGEEIIYINPNDILFIYRDNRVTKIALTGEEFETKTPLKELEARLKEYSFFRTHKSYLVNLNHVSRLIPWFNGAYHLEMEGTKEMLSVSRNYVKALRAELEL